MKSRGSALVTVLLALALMLSLGVPFLMASRLRSEASREAYERSRSRVAAASAGRYAAWRAAGSHPAADASPLWDSRDEWDPVAAGRMPQGLGEEWGSRESWGFEVDSAQAHVSLATAPPLVLQNLVHPCYVTSEVDFAATELPVTSTDGFPETGTLFFGELAPNFFVAYSGRTPRSFTGVQPSPDPPDNLNATRFRPGTGVLDPRLLNVVLGRMQGGSQHAPEFWGDVLEFSGITDPLPEAERRILERNGCLSSGAYGAADWEPAAWLWRPIDPDFQLRAQVTDRSGFAKGTVVRFEPELGPAFDALVVATGRGNSLLFLQDLPVTLEPFATRIHPLRREPVDLNSARPGVLEALVLGIRWKSGPPVNPTIAVSGNPGRDWIDVRTARDFAVRVVAARPLEGPDDLWERVLQPMAAEGVATDFEALAIHLNGIDPNDGSLDQSTLPFGYRSGDRYVQRVNAVVRSRLGNTLARSSLQQDVRAAPGGPLLRIWQTQEEFEDLERFSRAGHGVTTLPNNLGNYGGKHEPQNLLTLRTGLYAETGVMRPSDRDEDSYLLPLPAVEQSTPGGSGVGRTEHFEYEPSPLGYDVGERGPLSEILLQWVQAGGSPAAPPGAAAGSSSEALHIQGWFRMPAGLPDGFLFDLSGTQVDRSRAYAAIENGLLVLRAYDNAGEDPLDPENLTEAVEVELDPAEYGLADRWVHLGVLLRGISPRGLQLAVDGVPRGEMRGHTWLTQAAPGFAPGSPEGTLLVESTEGFADRGALRVGDEVIEYSSKTANSFVLDRVPGANGYLGGRAAREASDPLAASLDTVHPDGAAVEPYGYSAILQSDIPIGGGRLSGDLGPFSIARLATGPDDVSFSPLSGRSFPLGKGISCQNPGPLELDLLPMFDGDEHYAEAFQTDGGYAVIYQRGLGSYEGGVPLRDTDNCLFGGLEVVRYSARQDDRITIVERNVVTPGIAESDVDERTWDGTLRSFVTEWNPSLYIGGELATERRDYRLLIMPISVKGTGVSDNTYLPAGADDSEFVQITHDDDAGLTEWVRYDRITGDGAFLRDEWSAINRALIDFILEALDLNDPNPPPRSSPGHSFLEPEADPTLFPRGGAAQEPEDDWQFVRRIGEPVQDRLPEIESIRRSFNFRGVMGTHDPEHLQGSARFVPVFRTVRRTGAWSGYVGRLDRVAVMQPGSALPPSWYTVQWATAPLEESQDSRVQQNATYVAFKEDPGLPFPVTLPLPNIDLPGTDTRALLRLVKFPSGERPLDLDTLTIGGDVTGAAATFEGVVDEVSVHAPATIGAPGSRAGRSGLVLRADLELGELQVLRLNPNAFVVDGYRMWDVVVNSTGLQTVNAPTHGLLDIDGERIAYMDLDRATGEVTIAPDGRGMHGTEPRGHAAGATVWFVDGRPSSILTNGLTPGEHAVTLEDASRFGNRNLLLVDQELLHTFAKSPGGNDLLMPRRRPEPGDTDRYGDGILRGRFGTLAADHPAGALVYSFPCRWEDRYVPQSNSPGAAWFEIGMEEPNAYWKGLMFEAEIPDGSQQVRVLARSGPAGWEDEPGVPGLKLLDTGTAPGGGLVPLEFWSDRLDLRISFDWDAGAFDPVTFESVGWTTAPRVRRVVVDYLAESRVDRSTEVVE